jgi:hypothetical protein
LKYWVDIKTLAKMHSILCAEFQPAILGKRTER